MTPHEIVFEIVDIWIVSVLIVLVIHIVLNQSKFIRYQRRELRKGKRILQHIDGDAKIPNWVRARIGKLEHQHEKRLKGRSGHGRDV